MKMKRGRARADVCAVIDAGERVHGVLPEKTFLRCKCYSLPCRLCKSELIESDRAIYVKQDASGILADGLRLLLRQRDVAVDNLDSILGDGAFLFVFQRSENGLMNVIRNLGGSATD